MKRQKRTFVLKSRGEVFLASQNEDEAAGTPPTWHTPSTLATPLSPLRGFKAKLVLALMAELLLLLDLFLVIIYLVPFKSSDKTTRVSCEVNREKMREH